MEEQNVKSNKKIVDLKLLNDPPQTYIGEILNNNIHGYGFYYIIDKENEKLFYDGLFYANKLEGYNHIFYRDGSSFQGLFRSNKRFGPGVFTYPTGEQDVGLWDGFSIIRLGTSVHPIFVPKLAVSKEASVKTLKYRNLVSVCVQDNIDRAEEVLENLGANKKVLRNAFKLYNQNVRNKDNLFFNKNLYDANFFNKQDCIIDILVTEDEDASELKEEVRNELDLLSMRIEILSKHVKKLESILKKIESSKTVLLEKLNYCKNCCYISGSQRSPRKSEDVIEIKVPDKVERENILIEEKSFRSLSYDDLTFGPSDASIKDNKIPEIEKYLDSVCSCQEDIQMEDLDQLEKQLDIVLTEETFFDNIRKNMVDKVQRLTNIFEKRSSMKTKRVVVEEMLAWNNEEVLMDMLKHSFLHRDSEKMSTFKVSAILGGRRSEFSYPGFYEKCCMNFLTDCSLGEVFKIIEYLRKHNINVNLTDSAGNSGIFYAVARYRNDIIRTLVSFGANLDQINDEGLTPLTLCILCYLSQKYNIRDWEASFLPNLRLSTDEQTEVMKWHPSKSFYSMVNQKGDSLMNNNTDTEKKFEKKFALDYMKFDIYASVMNEAYVFDTNFRETLPEVRPGPVEDNSSEKSGSSLNRHEFLDSELICIESTIITLLESGASPNSGDVPLPPLIMAAFSENPNIVKKLLEVDADIHAVNPEGNLTCLHIIANSKCTQENVTICSLLLQHSCDPNARTSTDHGLDQKDRILGKVSNPEDIEDYGKNPLHILCLRRDIETDHCNFFEKVCNLLIKHGIDTEATYLGQNALSLAVLSGNLKLVETLLASGLTDPYKVSDSSLGNILTLLISDRFKDILPVNQCIEMLDLLVKLGVNPLRTVGECENVIDFIDRFSNKNKKDKLALIKNDPRVLLINYLKDLSQKKLLEHVRMEAVENLYNLTEVNLLDHEYVRVLAEFLRPETAVENLKLLFNCGKINIERFDEELCSKMLDYVEKYKREMKSTKSKKPMATKEGEPKTDQSKIYDYITDIKKIIFEKKQSTSAGKKKSEPPGGTDHAVNHEVCFQCLKGRNRTLTSCPRCHMIYFCSEQCNKLNLKQKNNEHLCRMNVFGDKTEVILDSEEESLETLCKLAREKVEQILLKRKQDELEFLMRKEEEERKLDVYGTKFPYRRKRVGVEKFSKLKQERRACDSKRINDERQVSLRKSDANRSRSLSVLLDEKLQRLSASENNTTGFGFSQKKTSNTLQVDNKKTQTRKVSKKKIGGICATCRKERDDKKFKSKIPLTLISKFEPLPNLEEPYLIIRKTKKIPKKPQYFMELLSKFFPNMDLSDLLLPYICYSNGHLYYQFFDEEYFCKNYSAM